MSVSGMGVAYAAGGFVLLWSGVKNTTLQSTLTAFLKGQVPTASPTGSPTIGLNNNATTASSSTSTASSSSVSTAPVSGAAEKANQAMGQMLAATYGWGTGAEWTALNAIVMQESGWNNHAQNPTSTAYGIGQFLDSTWASVGGSKTSDPATQINLMLKYIKQRYGDPIKAEQFHLANNYY